MHYAHRKTLGYRRLETSTLILKNFEYWILVLVVRLSMDWRMNIRKCGMRLLVSMQ
jgi:hypothetical protein